MKWRLYETAGRDEITLIPADEDTEDRKHLLGLGAVIVAEFDADTFDEARAVMARRYGWDELPAPNTPPPDRV